jgi:hypothetical protein
MLPPSSDPRRILAANDQVGANINDTDFNADPAHEADEAQPNKKHSFETSHAMAVRGVTPRGPGSGLKAVRRRFRGSRGQVTVLFPSREAANLPGSHQETGVA